MAVAFGFSLLILLCVIGTTVSQAPAPVPTVYILGDSTADVGTNNFLVDSTAKANFAHHGIDFAGGVPTGRFSNGFTTADQIAQQLGLKESPPPFLNAVRKGNSLFQEQTLKGINFASAGAGLRDVTGQQFGEVVPLNKQVDQFVTVLDNVTRYLGDADAVHFIKKSVVIISVGSNDIIEFFAATHGQPTRAATKKYLHVLEVIYEFNFRRLFNLGLRKFAVINVPPVGCSPALRALNPTGECLESINALVQTFNHKLAYQLRIFDLYYKEVQYSLGKSDEMVFDFLRNPALYGFVETKSACCGEGILKGEAPCKPSSEVCANRDEYLFWDQYHPTSAASELAALTLCGGPKQFVYPVNFKHLAEYDIGY